MSQCAFSFVIGCVQSSLTNNNNPGIRTVSYSSNFDNEKRMNEVSVHWCWVTVRQCLNYCIWFSCWKGWKSYQAKLLTSTKCLTNCYMSVS